MHPSFDLRQEIPAGAAAILESISDAFFAVNPQWEFTYLNSKALQLFAYRPEDLLGKNMWNAFPGLLGSPFETLYRTVAQEREGGSVTGYYPDHDRWYEARAYPAESGISVYFRDVSKRVQREQQLRESEARFRMMIDSIPQIVWIVDGSGKGVYFNKQWKAYTGVSLESIEPADVSQSFIHPDDDAQTMQAWQAAYRDGTTFVVEHRIRSASGQYRWFLVRAEPYRDSHTGKIAYWFGTSTDVHDRKLAEAALSQSEARYRSLFESIDEGFCIIEMIFDDHSKATDYRFLAVNPMFEQQTGLRDAQGKRMRELAPQHEEHWYEIYGQVAITGEAIRFESEARALNRWFDVYAFRIEDPADRKVALLFKDITQRRHIERELQLASSRKDEFLAMLAHELRNPLAPIAAAADMLRLARPDEARVRKTSEIIARQVRHMTGLVDDLLDVSRVTCGQIELEVLELAVKRIVDDAVEQVRPLIEARGHHFTIHMPPDAAFVCGDQTRLVQVMTNLLNNAAKYTSEGGNIELRMEVDDHQVTLTVSDNGIGMAAELVDRVFELFAQGERTSDRVQGGLGIGLALVKSLVELHHGSVAAHSPGLGQGSTFTVCLPRSVRHEEQAPAPQGEGVAMAQKGLRILIVEDNVDAAAMLAMFLEAVGHTVAVEHSSVRAAERARLEAPDVCLLDIGLPDVDGYELARRLRAQPETADTVLIAISGYGQERDRARSDAAGFNHHFVKPVDTAQLAALLAQYKVA